MASSVVGAARDVRGSKNPTSVVSWNFMMKIKARQDNQTGDWSGAFAENIEY